MAVTLPPSTKSAMTLVSISNIVFLIAAKGAQSYMRPFSVLSRLLVIGSITLTATISASLTALQYIAWGNSSLGRLLLPPHQPIDYFVFYSFTEFWANPILAAAIGLIFAMAIRKNAMAKKPFFYPEEAALCFASILLVGNPLWIAHLFLVLFLGAITTALNRMKDKADTLISFQSSWLLSALIINALEPFLRKVPLFIYSQF